MKNAILVCLFVFLSFSEGRGRRVKRDLFQLAEMIKYVTDRDPLNYNGYGCYCGWGGSGTPVDGADGCCKVHDDCYGSITNDLKDCSPKWNHYKWNISNKSIDCLDQTNKLDKLKGLHYSPISCPRKICECDKALVECLYRNQYNSDNYNLQDKGLKCKDNGGM